MSKTGDKDPIAVELGSRGGRKRWAKLTDEQRTELAKRLAAKRWSKTHPKPKKPKQL